MITVAWISESLIIKIIIRPVLKSCEEERKVNMFDLTSGRETPGSHYKSTVEESTH